MKFWPIFLSTAFMCILLSCNNKKEAAQKMADNTSQSDSIQNSDTIQQLRPETVAVNKKESISVKFEEIVSGQAFYRLSYCGGARPTPEMEAEFRKEYPLINQKIRLVQAQKPDKILEITTDGKGVFAAGLAPGVWNYYLIPTPGSKVPPNPNCNTYFSRSYGSVTVKAGDASSLKLLYSIPCDPCSPPRP